MVFQMKFQGIDALNLRAYLWELNIQPSKPFSFSNEKWPDNVQVVSLRSQMEGRQAGLHNYYFSSSCQSLTLPRQPASPCSGRRALPPSDWEATSPDPSCQIVLPGHRDHDYDSMIITVMLKDEKQVFQKIPTSCRGRSPVPFSSHRVPPASASSFLLDKFK